MEKKSAAGTFYDQNLTECLAMARYALTSGKTIPGTLLENLTTMAQTPPTDKEMPVRMRSLATIHAKLSDTIAPAVPRTIMLLQTEEENRGPLHILGPVPLIRYMMLTTLLFLSAFMLITLSPEVNANEASSNILTGSGINLLLNELFLLCAAGVGASFYTLFQANRYIQEGTFDPRYNASYWIRLLLGIIAGFILATVIDQQLFDKENSSAAGSFGRPLLAMIGGFSAAVVYRILSRITDTVESLFRGDMREMRKSSEEVLRTKLQVQQIQDRTRLASGLMELQKLAASGSDAKAIETELESLFQNLLGIYNEAPPSDSDKQEKSATPGAAS